MYALKMLVQPVRGKTGEPESLRREWLNKDTAAILQQLRSSKTKVDLHIAQIHPSLAPSKASTPTGLTQPLPGWHLQPTGKTENHQAYVHTACARKDG